MVQGYFASFIGAETVRFSECQFDLVVEAFDDAARKRLLGAKVVQENLAMLG